jgi:multiple sugar transport system permease protein
MVTTSKSSFFSPANREKVLWVGPAFIVALLLIVVPLVFLNYIMFFDWSLSQVWQDRTFIGLGNFLELFSDPDYWHSMLVTAVYVVVAVTAEFFLGLVIVDFLNREFRAKTLVMTILALPLVLSPTTVAIVWRFMFTPGYGLLSYVFQRIFGSSPVFLSPELALPSLILTDIWEWTPLFVLFLYAGVQSLSKDVLEAALMDGTRKFTMYVKVLIPMLKYVIIVTVLIRALDLLRTFDLVFVLTKGGPGTATEVLNVYIWRAGFTLTTRIGYVAAGGVILMNVSFVVISYLAGRIRRD